MLPRGLKDWEEAASKGDFSTSPPASMVAIGKAGPLDGRL